MWGFRGRFTKQKRYSYRQPDETVAWYSQLGSKAYDQLKRERHLEDNQYFGCRLICRIAEKVLDPRFIPLLLGYIGRDDEDLSRRAITVLDHLNHTSLEFIEAKERFQEAVSNRVWLIAPTSKTQTDGVYDATLIGEKHINSLFFSVVKLSNLNDGRETQIRPVYEDDNIDVCSLSHGKNGNFPVRCPGTLPETGFYVDPTSELKPFEETCRVQLQGDWCDTADMRVLTVWMAISETERREWTEKLLQKNFASCDFGKGDSIIFNRIDSVQCPGVVKLVEPQSEGSFLCTITYFSKTPISVSNATLSRELEYYDVGFQPDLRYPIKCLVGKVVKQDCDSAAVR